MGAVAAQAKLKAEAAPTGIARNGPEKWTFPVQFYGPAVNSWLELLDSLSGSAILPYSIIGEEIYENPQRCCERRFAQAVETH